MKYYDKEEVLFEDDKILEELVQKYFVVFDQFKRKVITISPTIPNYCDMLLKYHKVELSQDEFIELKSFIENDYAEWKRQKIDEELDGGYTLVDLTKII